MPVPEQLEAPPERKKRTILLLAGGVLSLLLPLLAVIYLRINENRPNAPSGRNDLFEHREGEEAKLTPSQAVVIPPLTSPLAAVDAAPPAVGIGAGAVPPPPSSSLDFVKSNDDLKARTAPPKVVNAPVAAPPPAPPPEPVKKAPAKTAAKKVPKEFVQPKLQSSKWSTNFKGSTGSNMNKRGLGKQVGVDGQRNSDALDPQAAGAGSPADLLKNLPPGAADDPRIQEYLKSHKQ